MMLLGLLFITAAAVGGVAMTNKNARQKMGRSGGRAVRSTTAVALRPIRAIGRRSKAAGVGWWGRWIITAHQKAKEAESAAAKAATDKDRKTADRKARWLYSLGDLMIGDSLIRCHVAGCDWSMKDPKLPDVVEHFKTHNKPDPEPKPKPDPAAAPQQTKPWSPFAPPIQQPPASAAASNNTSTMKGPFPMAIQTTTGGEVTNLDELKAELEGIRAEAAAEMEDANGDLARAKEDASRCERMSSTMSALNLPDRSLGPIRGLSEPTANRVKAAQDRAVAAEGRLTQANAALDAIQGQLAAKEALEAAGGAGDRQLYAGR